VAVIGSACSGNDDAKTSPSRNGTATSAAPRPAGPTADLSTEITGGQGVFIGSANPTNLERDGYVEHEYVAAGTASSYKATGDLTHDGRWAFEPDEQARYRTRVLVRQLEDPEKFRGTVVVEWLNVSGGLDADPEWASVREEIVRAGDVWVGVSAQLIGVEGGPVLVKVSGIEGADLQGKGLKAIDPERYGTLEHPGDGFSFDIFTQVARAIRGGAGVGGLRPKRLIAAGESQSAFALVTYYNGVQPVAHAFDAFYVHSRGAAGLPLVEAGKSADIAGGIGATSTIFRTDQDVPVLDVQTEGDVTSVLNSYAARQPDHDRFRLWEVAGTAHADVHLIGNANTVDCGAPINNGPMHVVAKAALHALGRWVESGKAPATAPRIEVTEGAKPQIRRDADGIAVGGVRTPPVDVPVAVLSGIPGSNPSILCLLLGSTAPLPAERLTALYPSREDYERRYAASADEAIKSGFVLEADRDALLAFSDPSRIA
jgi:hypothetical protein